MVVIDLSGLQENKKNVVAPAIICITWLNHIWESQFRGPTKFFVGGQQNF